MEALIETVISALLCLVITTYRPVLLDPELIELSR